MEEANPANDWELQRRTFERGASAYDRYRPSYPSELFDRISAYAGLSPADRIVEAGSGSGKATEGLAPFGNPIVCVEPSADMVDLARQKFADTPRVSFVNARFEDFDGRGFGLFAVAQAFHWLDEATRIERIARVLRSGGTAAVFGNRPLVDDAPDSFHTRVQDVYAKHAPGLMHVNIYSAPYQGHVLTGSPVFEDLERTTYAWEWTLSTDDYVGILRTHSPHAALDDERRTALLAGIAELVDRDFGGAVVERYDAVLDLARRV